MVRLPIGVVDSGIGGLTVLREVRALLPREDLVYLGDTARTPYGTKSAATVRRYAFENTEFLVERGIKALVVACNTAAAVALRALAQRYNLPVVGVSEPGAREAADATRSRRVGVIATEATIASGTYTRALHACDRSITVYARACPLFVPLAEEGWLDNEVARAAAERYLEDLRGSGIDTLILGCTHYPLLQPVIAPAVGREVRLIDSAAATARSLRRLLRQAGLARKQGSGDARFFVTDAPGRFVRVGRGFLGAAVGPAVRLRRRGGGCPRRS